MVVVGTIVSNMPELPEVETVKSLLSKQILGKTISHVDVFHSKNIDGDADEFVSSLKGRTVSGFSRVGKFIIFHFDNGLVMISHLRMEGKYYFYESEPVVGKHDLIVFEFDDGTYLTYNDTRRFGMLKLSNEDSYMKEPPLSNVGPDPFMMKDASRLVSSFKGKRIPIKQALLDQSIMSGLGNIYVDEVLFLSRIHPETPAKLITKKQLELVLKNSQEVLQKAINAGGSTIKSYHPGKGIDGNFQVQLKVYGHKGDACPNCGHSFRKIFVNGRGTTFCPKCQKNVALPYVIAISGPIASGKSLVGKYFAEHGYHIFDADACVHDLYLDKNVQAGLKKIIPELKIENGIIDKAFLKEHLLENPKMKQRLEDYIYKLVDKKVHKFISSFSNKEKVLLEVPMLFQSHIDDYADEIYLLSVDKKTQKERLLTRGVDPESYLKLNESYLRQEDKKKATAVIENNADAASLYSKLDKIISCKQKHLLNQIPCTLM